MCSDRTLDIIFDVHTVTTAIKSTGAGAATIGVAGAGVGIGVVFGAFLLSTALAPELEKQLFSYTILGFAIESFTLSVVQKRISSMKDGKPGRGSLTTPALCAFPLIPLTEQVFFFCCALICFIMGIVLGVVLQFVFSNARSTFFVRIASLLLAVGLFFFLSFLSLIFFFKSDLNDFLDPTFFPYSFLTVDPLTGKENAVTSAPEEFRWFSGWGCFLIIGGLYGAYIGGLFIITACGYGCYLP